MDIVDTTNKTCVASLKLLGDYWTLRIINALSDGQLRYCDLQRDIGSLNPATFTNRLKKLEDAKLIQRQESNSGNVTYTLSKLGQATLPVIKAINTFATKAKAST